jgi:uncharacterized protein YbjQ (UPF0145 family)
MVTTETVPLHRIVRVLGYVHGAAQGPSGGSDVSPEHAVWLLFAEAQRLGANAIVGVRWSEGLIAATRQQLTSSIQTYVGYRIYGTAVVIETEAC